MSISVLTTAKDPKCFRCRKPFKDGEEVWVCVLTKALLYCEMELGTRDNASTPHVALFNMDWKEEMYAHENCIAV